MTIRGNSPVRTDLMLRLGAAGARGVLLEAGEDGSIDLALRGDAFLVQMESAIHCSAHDAMDKTTSQRRESGLHGQRRSRCSDTARELRIERTWALAPIERIRLSPSLGRRLRRVTLKPGPTGARK